MFLKVLLAIFILIYALWGIINGKYVFPSRYFNSPNIIDMRYGGGLTWLIKKSSLNLHVIKEQKEEYETETSFSYLNFIIGFNIKF